MLFDASFGPGMTDTAIVYLIEITETSVEGAIGPKSTNPLAFVLATNSQPAIPSQQSIPEIPDLLECAE